jgi:hypothetical protein
MWWCFAAMKRLASLPTVILLVGLAIALGSACTTHGEGGRCDHTNVSATGGYLDCDDGLTCVSGSDIHFAEGGNSSVDICCPSDRGSLPVGDICALSPISPGSDASIPDGGFETSTADVSTDTTTTDVTTDSPVDAPTDVATDSPTDAPGQ